jgi:uncharacterized protein (TIGR00251 family)
MLLYIKVKPNQRFDKIEKLDNDWQICLKAPATEGKANKRLIDFLSEVCRIPKSKIILQKGKTSTIKCLRIDADDTAIIMALSDRAAENK